MRPRTHRDHDVGGTHRLVGQGFGELFRQVEAELAHHLHHGRVDLARGCAPGRAHLNPAARVVVEERGGHLAPACVVHAHEQHLGHIAHVKVPSCGTTTSAATDETSGYSTRNAATASAPPTS